MSSASDVEILAMKQNDNDNVHFDAPDSVKKDTNSAEVHPRKRGSSTFVQLVIDDNDSEAGGEKKGGKRRKNKGYSRTILLSALYGIIVSLVGLCLPLGEALTGEWQTQHWITAFLVYLYALSAAFLLYVQIYHVAGGKKLEKKVKKETENVQEEKTRHVSKSNSSNNLHANQGEVFVVRRPTSRLRASSSNLATLGETNEGFFLGGDEPDPGLSPSPSFVSTPFFKRQLTNDRDGFGFNAQLSAYSNNENSVSMLDGEEFDEAYEYIVMRSATATMSQQGGASFYIRLGTLLFAIANLLYTGLQIQHFQGADGICRPYEIIYPYYFQMLFVIIQTFFIFKNTTVMIRKHKGFVRFGVMHVLATNMCNWLRVLVYEIMEGIHEAHHPHANTIYLQDNMTSAGIVKMNEWDAFASGSSGNNTCNDDSIMKQAAPYLFPFILEYSLIAVAFMAGIFARLNIQVTKTLLRDVKRALRSGFGKQEATGHEVHHEEPTFMKAHLGMFFGIMLLTGTIVCIILFYNWNQKPGLEDQRRGDLVFQINDLVVNMIMIAATIPAMYKLYPMGFDLGKDNTIDHVLLLISLAGLFIVDLLAIVAGFSKLDRQPENPSRHLTVLNVSVAMVTLVQVLLQSIFIIDGLQRFADTDEQVEEKPGRGLITFLTVANVACWIYKILQEKKLHVKDELDFLGSPAWPIVQNIGLPLLLFFRFHSSICLAEMWHSAYEKEERNSIFEEEIME